MKIAIGSDHAGFELKEYVSGILKARGDTVVDVGPSTPEPVDYPEFGLKVASLVARGEVDSAVLVCGTGVGMSMVANKVRGVRAALAHDLYTAVQSRKHLDANILVLGGRVTGKGLAEAIVQAWLNTSFEGGRHQRRVEQIAAWEKDHLE